MLFAVSEYAILVVSVLESFVFLDLNNSANLNLTFAETTNSLTHLKHSTDHKIVHLNKEILNVGIISENGVHKTFTFDQSCIKRTKLLQISAENA